MELNWNLEPPAGFRGFDPDKPVTIYHRNLPHWRQDGASYFVTFRLADAIPQTRLRELSALQAAWILKYPPPHTNQQIERLVKLLRAQEERWLDEGMGHCWLRQPRAADVLATALHWFDGDRYELGCYAIMPNHCHVIVRPLLPRRHPLEALLHSWKRHSAQELNSMLNLSGRLWQPESYDRIIRDAQELYRTVQYVGRNPERAGLTPGEARIWISPAWEQSGWRFGGLIG